MSLKHYQCVEPFFRHSAAQRRQSTFYFGECSLSFCCAHRQCRQNGKHSVHVHVGKVSAGHLLTAAIAETSSSFAGFRRHMAAQTLNSALACSSEISGSVMRRTSMYFSNAGLINSHVAETMFLGNRNASVNAALCCIENRSFRSKMMASKAGMNTLIL
jgi:hypothetical protein